MSAFLFSAAIATAFNLSCDLHMKMVVSRNAEPIEADIRKTLRVDPATMRWCQNECAETKPIERFSPTVLVLVEEADRRIDSYESLTINRESGRLDHHMRINESSVDERGTCSAAAFTGFPARKF